MHQFEVVFYMHDESVSPWTGRAHDAADALQRAQQHFDEAIEGLTAIACDPLDAPPAEIPAEGTYAYQITDQSAAARKR